MQSVIILHLLSAMNFFTVLQPQIDFSIQPQTAEEKITILHCTLENDLWIWMWPSTYLVQQDGQHKRLLHIYNIPFHPDWKVAKAGHQFILLFEGLDSNCVKFDLIEKSEEKGGFIIKDIQRNSTDVYHLLVGRKDLQR